MTYNLFLDDERHPSAKDLREYVICRSVDDAKDTVARMGFPTFVSFDNDLGDGAPEGRNFAQWLVDLDISERVMPKNFAWYAHTQNPVARDAINGLLSAYMKSKGTR